MLATRYRKYLLALLLIILAFSYVDRTVFGIVLQNVKIDLDLTDTQLGILSGAVFALFYSLAGIPIARWADRGNRVTIVALTAAFWSVAVMLCGSAGNFSLLLLCRVGTAIGEAGCNPPANSLIPDYFSRSERPRAVARYMLGVPMGLVIGFLAGGWLNEAYGWRITFALIGLPGIVLALLAALTLQEPRCARARGPDPVDRQNPPSSSNEGQVGVGALVVMLARNSTFRNLLLCFLAWYFSGWALAQWLPAFFIRSHSLTTGELGIWLAVAYGIGGLAGTWIGGEWGSRYAAEKERLQLAGIAVLFVLVGVFAAGTLLVANKYVAFSILVAHALVACVISGPLFATIQTLVPSNMRATILALVSSLPTVVGMGLGPWAVGILSDALRPYTGDESLRCALIAICPGYLWAAWHIWRASKTVEADINLTAKGSAIAPAVRANS
jgi:MFS transporter, Spinster family, sphingosine-1-phosphate transporter